MHSWKWYLSNSYFGGAGVVVQRYSACLTFVKPLGQSLTLQKTINQLLWIDQYRIKAKVLNLRATVFREDPSTLSFLNSGAGKLLFEQSILIEPLVFGKINVFSGLSHLFFWGRYCPALQMKEWRCSWKGSVIRTHAVTHIPSKTLSCIFSTANILKQVTITIKC